jgi:hypothetical protein
LSRLTIQRNTVKFSDRFVDQFFFTRQSCKASETRWWKMDNNEFRAVIKHFWMNKKTATDLRDILQKVYDTSALLFSIISFWVSEFKRGRMSTTHWAPKNGHKRRNGRKNP